MSEVYKAIAAIQGELAKTGIAKEGNNQQQGYKFRGIDQVYGALSPLLAKHGLCVLPRIIEREMHERVTIKEWNGQKRESVLFYVTVTAEFDFVATADGSTHTVRTYGEAMDSGDKATNKAMSSAYKYAAFMAFAIPTEGDNDADATTHEVEPQRGRGEPKEEPRKPEYVTKAQAKEIANLIKECKVDEKAFLAWVKAESTAHILATHYDKVMATLADKKPKTINEELGDEVPYQ